MGRALFLLAVLPLTVLPAQAQRSGIQVAPVLVAMSSERNIASLRISNGRERPVAFEVDVYAWRQENGEDVLMPSRDLLVAPGVFEIAAGAEQVVRLGVVSPDPDRELAFRIILRELPAPRAGGNVLGFTLEMSLPVFVTPVGARPALRTQTVHHGDETTLVLSNEGAAHVQIASLENMDAGLLPAPRYLLAGASAEVALPARTRALRIRAAEGVGVQTERIVHVDRQDDLASVR